MPSLVGNARDELLAAFRNPDLEGKAKGDAFANLIGYIIGHTPGVTQVQYSRVDAFHAQEVDITFCQQPDENGFPQDDRLETYIFAECKNLSSRMDARDVAWFYYKLYTRGSRFGMLFSAQGLSGRGRLTGAQDVIRTALANKVSIVAFNGTEVAAWEHTDDFIAAVKLRITELVVNRTVWC